MKKLIVIGFLSIWTLSLSAQWQLIGGQAHDIGVGANGTTWVIGWVATPGGFGIGKWNGSFWENIPGGATRIDVGPNGNPWIVNDAGQMFRWNGGNWEGIGGQAHDIGIGANGTVWVIGWTRTAGGYNIGRWNGSFWEDIPGGAVRIDVDPNGNAWIVNDAGQIFKWNGRSWDGIGGQGRDISVGADGTVWLIGWNSVPGGYSIHRLNGSSWENVEGGLNNISAGPNDVVWGTNTLGEIWKRGNSSVSTRVMTRFTPVTHGFKFANTFANNGFVAGARINFSGLCGGMSYAALDYYFRNTPIPSNTTAPNEGTQLTEYIRGRQWKTYETQGSKWAELAATNWLGLRTSEFWNWGVQGFNGGRLQELRSQLDNGKPAILGLFAAGDGGFTSAHHQVIAIGYDMGRYRGDLGNYKDDLKIFICDPNYPNETMVLRPSTARQRYYYEWTPEQIARGYNQRNKEWLTYFVDLNYSTTTPLDPNVINRCTNVNFENQNMSGQTHNQKMYRCAKATSVNFRGATISGTDFGSSTLASAIFYGANCRNTNFAYSNLANADFYGADLKNCNFSNTDLKSVRFYGADLKIAIMIEANAQDANFEGADLHQGKFCRTSFKNARLYRTSLNTTDCKGADFRGANLTGADFRNADLTDADFTGAITTGIQLQGAIRTRTRGL